MSVLFLHAEQAPGLVFICLQDRGFGTAAAIHAAVLVAMCVAISGDGREGLTSTGRLNKGATDAKYNAPLFP